MIIKVLAKPGSRSVGVDRREDGVVIVRVRERAVDGKANEAVRRVLAEAYGCRTRDITIRSGLASRHKTVEVQV